MWRIYLIFLVMQISPAIGAKLPEGTFAVDNDLFVFRGSDRDYTGGIRYTTPEKNSRTLQAGLVLFTPDDIEEDMYLKGERPYANLLYVGKSYNWRASQGILYRRTWSVGLLGSRIGESVQRFVHKRTDSPDPQGYRSQISDGGELTGRLGITRYRHRFESATRYGFLTLVTESSASVGYITDATYGLGFRLQTRGDTWWGHARNDFLPHLDEPEIADGFQGFFGGVRVRVRAYNVMLQGQFRDSDVTFAADELRHVIAEAWLGVATVVHNWQVRYTLRYVGQEVRRGRAARSHFWAGLVIRKSI